MRDLIIDCFAGGGGASVGIEMALGRTVDIAINHDPEAIRMHTVNHPSTIHLTEDIFKVDLKKYVGDSHVSLMWASPDCTSHSKAKGSQPRNNGLRILPWAVYKHAKDILPDVLIMENVEEIQKWGPLDENGHPIKDREGEDYNKFIQSMMNLGYEFDSRELVAADYGAPTIRKRWYAIFRRDGLPIMWPEQTHSRHRILGLEPWKECGQYIDWSDLGTSIFGRKKPLAEATQKRIANGIRKYIIDNPNPYIVEDERATAFLIQYHGEQKSGESRGQVLTEPIKTIDTSNRYGLVTAFITKFYKTGIGQGCDEPLHTITTSPGHFGLISAYAERISNEQSNNMYKESNRDGCNRTAPGRDFLEEGEIDTHGNDDTNRTEENGSEAQERLSRCGSLEQRETIFINSTQGCLDADDRGDTGTYGYKSQRRKQTQQQSKQFGGCDEGRKPLTRLQNGIEKENELCEGLFFESKRTEGKGTFVLTDSTRTRDFANNSIQSKQLLISSWIMKYYGTGCGQELHEPLATITTKDRFGLVNVILDIKGEKYVIYDIFLRMLKPEELKLMQGFPEDYIIDRDINFKPYPTKEQVARIGNSVVPIMAEKLVESNCGYLRAGMRKKNMLLKADALGQISIV